MMPFDVPLLAGEDSTQGGRVLCPACRGDSQRRPAPVSAQRAAGRQERATERCCSASVSHPCSPRCYPLRSEGVVAASAAGRRRDAASEGLLVMTQTAVGKVTFIFLIWEKLWKFKREPRELRVGVFLWEHKEQRPASKFWVGCCLTGALAAVGWH